MAVWEHESTAERDSLHGVGSLHGAQESVMERGHEEALGEVIEVLAQGQDVVALAPCTGVQPTSLHARAETAY